MQDSSGSVFCFDVHGQRLWETEVPGASALGTRVTDTNNDGLLEVVIAGSSGQVVFECILYAIISRLKYVDVRIGSVFLSFC